MNRTILALTGLAGFVLLSGFHGGCGGKPSPERVKQYAQMRLDDELDDLKATPDQRAKLHGQVEQLFPDAIALYQEHQKTKAEVVDVLAQDRADGARLHAIVDQRIDAVRAFAHKVADAVLVAHDTLNPQQRATLVGRAREHLQER